MRYRDARLLIKGDVVIDKANDHSYVVETIEVYGNVKTVRINCEGKSFLNWELKK